MSTMKKIKPLEDYRILSDEGVVSRGVGVYTGTNGNPNFPNPPFPLADLKTGADNLSALMAESLDGSKKVIAEKNKQREAVIKMLRLLGRYVEVTCKEDMAIFKSSGFEPASTTRTAPQHVSQNIRTIDHGAVSGQIVVQVKAVPKSLSYELRYGAALNGGAPATWITELVTGVKAPVIINGLTPGTIYAFQVRSLGKAGYSDWSDSVTLMCI